ncbi:phosphoadenosine phosphosulfate reductase family protein [Micromonospora arborensis]|uniref:phosphoadenosine phosphosulfate reductase family protein n=1 Tax=Micromonospora arborensis TaxID=2116518 RepID=UPI0033FE8DF7
MTHADRSDAGARIHQLTLWAPPPLDIRMADYDVPVVNTSGGKDSAAIAVEVARRAREEGVLDRVVAVHADLGVMEWPGTRELAERQARHLGITRFEVVRRSKDDQFEDLLGYALRHGKWPGPTTRWCTSDLKRNPTEKLIRRLSSEVLAREPGRTTPVRVLNCLGMRAQESARRAKQPPLSIDTRLSCGTREVTRWLPVHDWTTEQVFAAGDTAGVERHVAYSKGQSRASCVLCILLKRDELVRAAQANPLLAQCYAVVEKAIGHQFRLNAPMADILAEAGVPELPADTPLEPRQWAHLIEHADPQRMSQWPQPAQRWADVVAFLTPAA